MKKILLTAAAIATLSLNSTSAIAAAESFYLKANGGGDKLLDIKTDLGSLKLKSKNNIFFGAGAGYYVMDNVRAELAFDHYLDPEFKGNGKGRLLIVDVNASGKLKTKADVLLVNGFVDLFDVSIAKVFFGAGVGIAMISGDMTIDTSLAATGTPLPQTKIKYKKKNNLAYGIHLGTSAEVSPGVNVELTYSFRDMGKLAKAANTNAEGPHLKGHHVAAGVRFDI